MIVFSRQPGLLADPRFWAEEGLVHMVNAFHNPVLDALIYVNVTGYLVLVANIGTVLAANLLPLPWSPYATMACAALIHALPALLIASAQHPNWSPGQRVALILMTLVIGPSGETWLNTINSQFVLVVVAALLLITQHRAQWWRLLLCITVPLASPVPAFLAPLFVLRAALSRQRRHGLEAVCYLAGAAMAASIAVWYSHHHAQFEAVDRLGKDLFPDIIAIAHVLAVKTTGFLGGGDWGSQLVYGWLLMAQEQGSVAYGSLAIALALPPFMLGAWAAFRRPAALMMFAACGLVLGLIMIFAGEGPSTQLAPTAGRRYLFPINVLLMLTITLGFWPVRKPGQLSVAYGGLALVLAINAGAFWLVPTGQTGPSWRAQTQAWGEDPTRPVQFWPGGQESTAWSARLTPPLTVQPGFKTTADGGVETRLMRWREEPVVLSLLLKGQQALMVDAVVDNGETEDIDSTESTESIGADTATLTVAQARWHFDDGRTEPLALPAATGPSRPHIGTEYYLDAISLPVPSASVITVPDGATQLTMAVGIDYRRRHAGTTATLRITPYRDTLDTPYDHGQ